MSDAPHHDIPQTLCWHCDRLMDVATPMEDEGAVPDKGAVSLCFYCGAVCIFAEDLVLRAPTKDELDDLARDKSFRGIYTTFSWHRQYVMIEGEGLMRKRGDPDR